MPNKKETYIHRIGRSARLDRSGTAISFVSQYDDFRLQELEEYLGNALEFHDSSELEAVIADAETLRKLGTPKSQKEEKGKELRKDCLLYTSEILARNSLIGLKEEFAVISAK